MITEQNFDLPLDSQQRFLKARQRAVRQDLWARLTGRSSDLLPFEALARALQTYAQIPRPEAQMIPLDRIVGSVGRPHDFTRDFLPRDNISLDRWVQVDQAMDSPAGVPPVTLYQLGDVYFVADGNHRVSVARANGFDAIEAYVTEIPADANVQPGDTLKEAIVKVERARFFTETDLLSHVPEAAGEITFIRPGDYMRLLDHVEGHRYFIRLDEPEADEVSFAQAAVNWYTQVYAPIMAAIQRQNLTDYFPHNTAAELYLWISAQLLEQTQQHGPGVTPDEVAAALQGEARPSFKQAVLAMQRAFVELILSTPFGLEGLPDWAGIPLEWGDFQPAPTTTSPDEGKPDD